MQKTKCPCPPRGYWARLQHGYKVLKTPLSKLKIGVPDSHTISNVQSRIRLSNKLEGLSDDAVELINFVSDKPTIKVLPQLESLHLLKLRNQKNMKKAKVEENSVITPPRKGCLNINVASSNLDRALRIMDALVTSLKNKFIATYVCRK